MATTTDKTNWVKDIGRSAFDAIREMVKALQVDWERLKELREERDDYGPDDPDDNDDDVDPLTWAERCEEEAEELAELEAAAGDCIDEDEARQRIHEDPLSIELGGWWTVGSEPEPTEYRILLTTGGPAVRIVGDLGQGNEPASASLEVQDWFKPWTEYRSGVNSHDEILEAYVACFYFGD